MASNEPTRALELRGISSGYGTTAVVHSVTLAVSHGEVVALLGPNGCGKSTLLKAAVGLVPLWQGKVFVSGREVHQVNPKKMLDVGVALTLESSKVFDELTVLENLKVFGSRAGRARLSETLDYLPALKSLKSQRADTLSGGERHQLALGNALATGARVLLLDEPTVGLAPRARRHALSVLQSLARDHGLAVLIVEQTIRSVLQYSDRAYWLANGQLASRPPAEYRMASS